MNSIFVCKRLKIAKFFVLKRSTIFWEGAAITAPGDTNPNDATGDSQPFWVNDTLDSIYEISRHTAFNSIIVSKRLMLLNVTLE